MSVCEFNGQCCKCFKMLILGFDFIFSFKFVSVNGVVYSFFYILVHILNDIFY